MNDEQIAAEMLRAAKEASQRDVGRVDLNYVAGYLSRQIVAERNECAKIADDEGRHWASTSHQTDYEVGATRAAERILVAIRERAGPAI